MSLSWDHRVVPLELLDFVRRLQDVAPSRLAGGAALSGLHLHHRLSRDLDIFCDSREDVREALRAAMDLAETEGGSVRVVRDGGSFVRTELRLFEHELELDLIHEPSVPLEARSLVDGVLVDSLQDLQANKIMCLLSRAEPRDLVDLYFLERSGHATEAALPAALRKDAGIDPGILAFLLTDFPTQPLPLMLQELRHEDLRAFRDDLAARLRASGLPLQKR